MDWIDIYSSLLDDDGQKVASKIKAKQKYIKLIKSYAGDGKLLEAGCGTAVVSSYLAQYQNVSAIDLDEKMVDLAKKISKKFFNGKNKIKQGSILELPYKDNTFEVSFSNGVLEHFSDEDIIKVINEQLRVAKYMIFGIPSCYYDPEEAAYGNERFLPKKHWLKLIEMSGAKLLKVVNFSDEGLFNRIKKVKKWFRPSPFFIFVLERK